MEEAKVVAALVASLISQALLSILLHLPLSKFPLLPPFSFTNPNNNSQFLPLLLHLISTSQIAASAAATSLLPHKKKKKKKKRKREEEEEVILSSCSALILPNPNPDHFQMSFRMSSSTFEWLSGLLDPLLDCRDPSGSSLHLLGPTRLAIALFRLATGAPYPDIACRFAISEPAARFCTKRLCRVLCTNFRFWLAFPTEFQSLPDALPDCCGAITCARFEICGGRAVAAQIVADASSRILSIAAGFRGERGDAEVLRSSSLYKDVEMGRLLGSGQYLVGGVGYPLLSWLMVPFANAVSGSIEEDFNTVQGLMCRSVQRAVSSLRDWGVMSRLMEEEDGKMAVACIGTCALLHNVLLMREDYSAISDVSMESLVNVEKCGDKSEEGLKQECCAERKAFLLRSTLAMKVKAVHNYGQNL